LFRLKGGVKSPGEKGLLGPSDGRRFKCYFLLGGRLAPVPSKENNKMTLVNGGSVEKMADPR